jgi:hypothetical protein
MRRRLRMAVFGLDTRPVELLTAQLSLWFAVALWTSASPNRPEPFWLWSGWCAAAGLAKALGVGATLDATSPRWSYWSRRVGSFLGLFFWFALTSVFFFLARGGISWGGYFIIALAQSWCFLRLWRAR